MTAYYKVKKVRKKYAICVNNKIRKCLYKLLKKNIMTSVYSCVWCLFQNDVFVFQNNYNEILNFTNIYFYISQMQMDSTFIRKTHITEDQKYITHRTVLKVNLISSEDYINNKVLL